MNKLNFRDGCSRLNRTCTACNFTGIESRWARGGWRERTCHPPTPDIIIIIILNIFRLWEENLHKLIRRREEKMRIGGKTLEKRTTNGLRKRTHELLFIGWLIVCEHLNCWNQKELDVVISTSQQHFPHWFVEQDQLRIVDNVSERCWRNFRLFNIFCSDRTYSLGQICTWLYVK